VITQEIETLNERKCELEGVKYQGTFYTKIPLFCPHSEYKFINYYRDLLSSDDFAKSKEVVRDLVKLIVIDKEKITLTIRLNHLLGNKLFQDIVYDVKNDRQSIMSGYLKIVIR